VLAVAVAAVTVIWCAGASAGVVGSVPVGASWQTNGRVETIVVSGDTAYLGGSFTSVRPSGDPLGTGEVARNGAAAVDITTGDLLPWNPNVTGTVQTIAVGGSTVYLGGVFSKVGGKNHKNLAEVDAVTGAPLATFKPKTNAGVYSIVLADNLLYAGGAFTTADGVARSYLAAFDPTTGALSTTWVPTADRKVNAIALTSDGSRLVVGGTFLHVDGSMQPYLTAVSPTTGALLPWYSHPLWATVALAVDANGVYTAGAGNGGNFDAYNPSTGQMRWIGGVDGNVQAITVMEGLVYVGGHFNNYCGPTYGANVCRTPAARDHLLAVNELTGAVQAWHPSANGVLGVFALTGADSTLLAGGDFTQIGGVSQQGFAEFPEITDPAVTDSAGGAWTNAATVTVTAAGSVDNAPGGLTYKYETSTDGGITWSAVRSGSPATVKGEGQTIVQFEAVDPYGNTSDWVQDTVRIDRTPPTTPTVGLNTNACALPGYTVTAASTDTGSGVAYYAYELSTDGGLTWTAPVQSTSGSVGAGGAEQIRFQAVDAAGNASGWSAPLSIPPC
jgi:hypothetical protein